MAKVEIIEHINNGNFTGFNRKLKERVSELEKRGLDVEIQYQTTPTTQGTMYSALLVCRQTPGAMTPLASEEWLEDGEKTVIKKDVSKDS